jgi:hypothetical protein
MGNLMALLLRFLMGLLDRIQLPDIEDEAGVRAFLMRIAAAAEQAAAVIPGYLDNAASGVFRVLVADDQAWPKFYELLKCLWGVAPSDGIFRQKVEEFVRGLPEGLGLQVAKSNVFGACPGNPDVELVHENVAGILGLYAKAE